MSDLPILTDQRAVTASGTPEKLQETAKTENKVIAVRIRAKTGNAGDVYITNERNRDSASTEGDIIAPGELYIIDVSTILGAYIDLNKLWIDAANSGDGVSYTAIEAI